MNSIVYDMLKSLSSKIDNSEQLLVPFLVKKAEDYLVNNAHDKTVGIMNISLNKMLENNKGFITRAEFKNLYNKSYNYGTKAASLFSDELNIKEVEKVVKIASIQEKELEVKGGDTILSNALSDMFDGKYKEYSDVIASKALESVNYTLGLWGLSPKNLSINAGNEKVLIIKADYETPKGMTSVVIPVGVDGDKVIESGMFLSNLEPQELNYNSLKNHIKANAGVKLAFNSEFLLKALTNKLSGESKISSAEMALIRFKSKKNAGTEFVQNSIIGQELDSVVIKDIQQQKYADTDLFEAKLATSYGEAVFKFGSDIVSTARDIVINKLSGLGYKSAQVKLANYSVDALQYAVNLGSVAFTTSVKIKDKMLKEPTYILCNGSVSAFNSENLNSLINESFDSKAGAVASPLFGVNAGELISIVEAAVKEKNLQKAEDALNVLANDSNTVAYAKAFEIYLDGLKGKEVVSHKCSKMIKHSSSNQMICSHTGLPINKIASDKHGNCVPLYRKNMNDTFEGVITMTSKVFI